jgi:hypothetical protein
VAVTVRVVPSRRAAGRQSASSYYESTTTKKNLKINCNLILNGDDTRASMHDERLC